jgi:hypothetical protein
MKGQRDRFAGPANLAIRAETEFAMKRTLLWSALALTPVGAAASPAMPIPQTAAAVPADAPFGSGTRMAGKELAAITGRADTALVIRAANTSTVSNNSVNGVSQTGAISFDERAFANLSGLSLLSANTGNNVSINSSLNLNVAIQR